MKVEAPTGSASTSTRHDSPATSSTATSIKTYPSREAAKKLAGHAAIAGGLVFGLGAITTLIAQAYTKRSDTFAYGAIATVAGGVLTSALACACLAARSAFATGKKVETSAEQPASRQTLPA